MTPGSVAVLPLEFAGRFPVQVRQRGDRYHHLGRVSLIDASENLVVAEVRGSSVYRTTITRTGSTLQFSCSCPYGSVDGICKHTWATLLEARATLGIPERNPGGTSIWQTQVRTLGDLMATEPANTQDHAQAWPANRRIVYVLDVHATSLHSGGLVVEVATQKMKDGEWAEPRPARISHATWMSVPDLVDREIAQMLMGAQSEWGYHAPPGSARRYAVSPAAFDTTIRRMVESGRAFLRVLEDSRLHPLTWDDGAPWVFQLRLEPHEEEGGRWYTLQGHFVRGEERMDLQEPGVVIRGGLLVIADRLHRFVDDHLFAVIVALRTSFNVKVQAGDALDLIEELYRLPRLPLMQLPDEFSVTHVHEVPGRVVALLPVPRLDGGPARVEASLAFTYGGVRIPAASDQHTIFDRETMRIHHRDRNAELRARDELLATGFRLEHDPVRHRRVLRLPASRAERMALELARSGWEVTLEGQILREALDVELEVRAEIDWFELHGDVSFGELRAGIPELLAAVRRGDRRVTLSDGSAGVLPEDLYDRLALLTTAGTPDGAALRYRRSQAGLLDAMLAAMPAVRVDETFARIRDELQRFQGITPADPSPGFVGELREYQREGLGWLHFLRQFGFGGCLADDMGLGKTVQALALLEHRRSEGVGPSLVVVPNSLVFNWQQEALRFAPKLRVLVHAGVKRRRDAAHHADHDLVITTYGTLRRDAPALAKVEFDYVILDEAQAIKNAATDSAKAARVLRARHRLAMSGTPIENRLAELWSLLDFLNPGMLGSASAFARLAKGAGGNSEAPAEQLASSREMLARVVRPYVLRRTKEQVAPELPAKLEQTLFVDLERDERKRYDELRDHYRVSLLQRIAEGGMARSQVHILEALLRLRQAACHPGLIDPARTGEASSKLDVLEARVREAVEEGHKVLVFSQFTSLLAIVRRVMDEAGIVYEYLDGQTRDRQARVERFQGDPSCPVFLISLKAGGLGLNLTAADYVFLLDPWWNPAVESQAIDRTHRIGQMRRVFATRLIARDTVEEKVLLLQERKRDLADAIIRAEQGPLAMLTREELESLLS